MKVKIHESKLESAQALPLGPHFRLSLLSELLVLQGYLPRRMLSVAPVHWARLVCMLCLLCLLTQIAKIACGCVYMANVTDK